MSATHLKSQIGEMLSALRRAVARREEHESIYREALTVEDRPRPDELQRRLSELHATFSAERSNAEEMYQRHVAAIETHFETDSQQIEREARDAAESIRSDYQRASQQTEDKYQENRWLMSSLVDDRSEESPKRKLDALRDRLNQAALRIELDSQGLDDLHQQALQLVERRGVACELPPVERAAPTASSTEAQQRFTECEQAAQIQFRALQHQFVAHLFSSTRLIALAPAIGLAIVGLGFFGLGFFGLDRDRLGLGDLSPEAWLIGWGVAGGIVALLFGVFAAGYSRGRTQAGFESFFQSFSLARQYQQLFESMSQRELADAEARFTLYEQQLVQHRERSLQRFSEERKWTAEGLVERRDELLRQVEADRVAKLNPLVQQREQTLAALSHNHAAYLQQLAQRETEERTALEAAHQHRVDDYRATLAEIRRILVDDWQTEVQRIAEQAQTLQELASGAARAWESIASPNWDPPANLPTGIPFGAYRLDLHSAARLAENDPELTPRVAELELPAVAEFPAAPSIIIRGDAASRPLVERGVQSLALRWLTALPPGSLRLTVIDSRSLGEPFSAFMHLADFNELLISHRIWTEPAHIDRQLTDLTEHMENVFQKYLRNEFDSIEDYNRAAGEVAEPYRLLVVSGFPHGFGERAAQRLASIAASGAKCGVYLLLAMDAAQPLPRGFEFAALAQSATVFDAAGGAFRNSEFGVPPLECTVDPPPEPARFATIVKRVGEVSLTARRVEVAFRRIAPADEKLWSGDSRKMLDVPLGRAGATKLQHLRLGLGTSQHVLIAGRTGSGKSTLLHVIVTNAALHYSPQELEFYLIDFKKGVEFKAYAEGRLPHARVIAIESDREFGLSALERLDAELKLRGDMFRRANVQDLEGFREARPDETLPRILLVIDEFQEFFVEDDRLAQNATLLLDRLVRQGRAFGIHVLLGSQTLGGAYSLARTTLSQMAVRIALQCSENDAHLILSESNTAARLLNRPGEAIYNDANGLVEGNSPFQVSWLDDRERETALAQIRELARARDVETVPAIVFEGNRPAELVQNAALVARFTGESPPRDDAAEPSPDPAIWLGDPVTIGPPTAIELKPRPAGNLLIVGQDEETARGLLAAALLSLSGGTPGSSTEPVVRLLDPRARGQSASRHWGELLSALPERVACAAPDQLRELLDELRAELERRKEGNDSPPPQIVLIDDLSQFRELRKGDDDFGFGGFGGAKDVSPAQRFAELLKDGPALGLHFILWCSSYNNVDRWLGRALLREFELRVVLQMNAADSSNLIDSPAANRLGQNRAILYRDDQGTTEKFRPYGFPDAAWWDRVAPSAVGSETQRPA